MNEYFNVSTAKNKDNHYGKEDVLSVSGDYGIVNQIKFQGRSFAGATVANYGVVNTGDVVYTKSPLSTNPYGIIKANKGKAGIVSTLYAVYKPCKNVNSEFVQVYFELNSRMNNYMQPLVNKGAKNDMKVTAENALKGGVCFPKLNEQNAIVEYFRSLDHLITLHQCKCHLLLKLLHNDWEQRKFGDLVEKYEDPIDTPTDGYMRLGIRSHAKGTFHSYVEKGKELETAKMFRVAANNFIVNITFGWEHAVAITDESDAGKLVSHRFPQYSFENGMIPMFFKYLILDENFKHHLELSSPGGAGRNRVLKLNDMLEYKMKFPCEDEQRKLASYFDDLDHLITLHQRKCEETKKLKKYMLQKMFPQNGQTVPEIRFSGFTDAWEQRKLGEIATETYGGGTPKTSNEEFWKGDIPWIQSSDLIDECLFDVRPRKCISQEAVSKSATKLVPQNSIAIVTRVGVGKLAFMPFSYATSQDFLSLSGLKIDPEFTVYALYKMMQSVSNEVQGTSIKGVTKDELLAKKIIFPSCNEQKKIGAYLHNLDHLITLHHRKYTSTLKSP